MHSDSNGAGTMPGTCYDVASVLWQGARAYQEDHLVDEFPEGLARGYVVLADGMGGHAAGDVASQLAAHTVADGLTEAIRDADGFERDIAMHLRAAVRRANRALADEAGGATGTARMGTTLVTAVLCDRRLYWTSVGDSPMYLWRDGTLHLLNEDHSMAPVIDRMAADGELTPEAARNHPDRNALTSVLAGGDIARIDLSADGFDLLDGDVVIIASDGLQFLHPEQMVDILDGFPPGSASGDICQALLDALMGLDDPHQDNVSICVLQPCPHDMPLPQARTDDAITRPVSDTTRPRTAADQAAADPVPRRRSRLRALSDRMKFW